MPDPNEVQPQIAQTPPSGTPPVVEAPKSSPLAPAKPRQPTAEELKQTFTIDDAMEMDIQQLPPQKAVEPLAPKKEEAPKPDSPETPPVPEHKEGEGIIPPKAGTMADGKTILPPSKTTPAATRDYAGFSAEEQALLKQMSNPAFEYVRKLAMERKELEKLKGAQFLQHPQAFTLDPEYQRMQEDNYYASAEYRHWEQQLAKVKNGEDWAPLESWDAQGNPKYGAMRPATSQDEENIRLAMSKCLSVSEQINVAARSFVGNYQQRVAADNQLIMQEQAKRFGWVADPKLLDEKLNINGNEKTLRQIKQEFVNLFPAYHHNSVAVDVAANLFVASIIQGIRLEQAEAGKQVAEIKKEEVLRAEPTSAATRRQVGKQIGGVTEFSLKDLPV